jgi:hypothetical protein
VHRQNPAEYEHLRRQKYIQGVEVERPAVISINLMVSSLAINEFLNRIHPFKDDPPDSYARIILDLCGNSLSNESEKSFTQDMYNSMSTGLGDSIPFLRMPELKYFNSMNSI